MPLGVQIPGENFVILVGTVDPPTTPVGGLSTWDYPSDAPTARRDYYGQASFFSRGKKGGSMTFTCDLETGDSGQIILFNAWVSGATIYARIRQNATDGETLPVKVTTRNVSGGDVNNPSVVTFTLSQQADATVAGSGFGT